MYQYKDKIRWWIVIWLLRKKGFRQSLRDVLFYAFNNHHIRRGPGASDVVMFMSNYTNNIVKSSSGGK